MEIESSFKEIEFDSNKLKLDSKETEFDSNLLEFDFTKKAQVFLNL